jgi:short-subunit dehydrogenase
MGTALVTGATSGIGREFCWQLSNAGNDLVMVARNRGRLDALATNIRRVNGVNVEVLVADLAEPDDLAQVCRRLAVRPVETPDSEELPSSVDLLVNNAGFGFDSSFLDDDFDKQLYGLDVMVRAVMATCYYGGRQMRSAGRGGIINVSSVAADTGMGPYSAHKAWVRTFSEGLYEELSGERGQRHRCHAGPHTH